MADSPASPQGNQPAASPAPSTMSAADKVAAAKAAAVRQSIPGASDRVNGRASALAKLDKHVIAREMEAKREARTATPPAVQTQAERARDEQGRFAAKPTEQPAEQKPAAVAATTAAKPADGKPGAVAEKSAEHAALEQQHSALQAKYDAEIGHLRAGSAQAADKIADIEAERDHFKAVLESFRAAVRAQFKVDIDPIALKLAEANLAISRSKRGETQRQQAQQQAAISTVAQEIVSFADGIIAKFPELDPKVDPKTNQPANRDAAAFWAMRLRADPTTDRATLLRQIEADAEAFATVLRGRQVVAQRGQQPAQVQQRQRPESTLPYGGGATEGGEAGTDREARTARVSTKNIMAHMAQFRAIRGGRG